MVFSYEAATNWFLTWDEDTADQGKSFLLQIELQNLVFRDFLKDGLHTYVSICRQRHGSTSGWELVGKTSVLRDEPNPAYPEGFRVFYDQDTNLSEDLLRVICYRKRDGFGHEEVLGMASISMRELLRTFGTRVMLELVKEQTDKVMGSVWFLGEPLPNQSPKGGGNILEFRISGTVPRRADVKLQAGKLFVVVGRERSDMTWSVVCRSHVIKKLCLTTLVKTGSQMALKPFQVRQSELVLGQTPKRRVRFSFFQKGKRGEPHLKVGEVTTTADELLHEFSEDTSLDLKKDGKVVGEFANMSKTSNGKVTTFVVEINYFDFEQNVRQIQERRKNKALNLDSP